MRYVTKIWGIMALVTILGACTTHYRLTGVSRERIVVDKRYDRQPEETVWQYIAPFKHRVDSIMCPIVGHVAHDMSAERPESDLSNLLGDILVWAGRDYGEEPVLGVYNMGGIRAALTKGAVSYGDVLDVAPFENKICFLTLTGEKLTELLQQIAARGGEGVSHGLEMVITKDLKLVSARLFGKEIDPKGSYRIATINYLAQGNDGMTAFKDGTDLNSPQEERNNTRFIIMNYFRFMEAQGKLVDSKMEGRIRIEN